MGEAHNVNKKCSRLPTAEKTDGVTRLVCYRQRMAALTANSMTLCRIIKRQLMPIKVTRLGSTPVYRMRIVQYDMLHYCTKCCATIEYKKRKGHKSKSSGAAEED